MKRFIPLLFIFFINHCYAIDGFTFSSPEHEKRFHELTKELLCPVCDGQNLAESNAPIAKDLRREIYRMLEAGKTNEQITLFMVERYGQSISSQTPLNQSTYVLWLIPIIFLLVGVMIIVIFVRHHRLKQE